MTKRVKKRSRAVPEDASEIERAVVLARKIGCRLTKLLDPPKSSHAETLLFAAIGRKYAETQPEFSRGSGRLPGEKYKKEPLDTKRNKRLRRHRDNKAAKELAEKRIIEVKVPGNPPKLPTIERLELEPGISLEPVWKRRRLK